MGPHRGDMCHLRISSPVTLRGSTLRVATGRSVIGRAPGSHVRIDSPDVSRTHAAIDHRAGLTTIEDLGSTHGTIVNGVPVPVHEARPVHHGDQVRFGSVVAVFEDLGSVGPPTGALILPPEPAARYDIGDQHAGTINNVARDQYIYEQRESFLREIAASRTRARRLIVVGLALFLAGFVAQAIVAYQFSTEWQEMWNGLGSDPAAGPEDLPTLALPVAVLSSLVAGLGLILMVVGLVLHVIATARRRRVATTFPTTGTGAPRDLQHRQPARRHHQQRRP